MQPHQVSAAINATVATTRNKLKRTALECNAWKVQDGLMSVARWKRQASDFAYRKYPADWNVKRDFS